MRKFTFTTERSFGSVLRFSQDTSWGATNPTGINFDNFWFNSKGNPGLLPQMSQYQQLKMTGLKWEVYNFRLTSTTLTRIESAATDQITVDDQIIPVERPRFFFYHDKHGDGRYSAANNGTLTQMQRDVNVKSKVCASPSAGFSGYINTRACRGALNNNAPLNLQNALNSKFPHFLKGMGYPGGRVWNAKDSPEDNPSSFPSLQFYMAPDWVGPVSFNDQVQFGGGSVLQVAKWERELRYNYTFDVRVTTHWTAWGLDLNAEVPT